LTYKEAIDFLFSSLPMYQRVGKAAYKTNLKNTLALDEYFGHPHKNFHTVHIAGTNGKGSVAHMLASVMQSAGYRTGLYTSPHLKDFRERIRVSGNMISRKEVIGFVEDHRGILEKIEPSFFEMTVAMAFNHFIREKVDIAVVEVGMGGRLDSTNIISPLVSVITNIGMDHSSFLGNTLQKITVEKAGIMKPGIPVVIGEMQDEISDVFFREAEKTGCSLTFADNEYRIDYSTMNQSGRQVMQVQGSRDTGLENLELDLLGIYQRKNVITLFKVIDILNDSGKLSLDENVIRAGLRDVSGLTGLRGRWEILSREPLVVCDTAHNSEGIEEVVGQIRQIPWKKLHIIIGFVDDKDPSGLLKQLPQDADYYFTQAAIPRAMDKEKLAMEALKYGIHGQLCMTPVSALALARENAGEQDMIFVGGSTFVVADVIN
jgi:dihydrofolate synthase / folylpolyglutamate synthase